MPSTDGLVLLVTFMWIRFDDEIAVLEREGKGKQINKGDCRRRCVYLFILIYIYIYIFFLVTTTKFLKRYVNECHYFEISKKYPNANAFYYKFPFLFKVKSTKKLYQKKKKKKESANQCSIPLNYHLHDSQINK